MESKQSVFECYTITMECIPLH